MKNLRRDLDGGYIGGADILVYQNGETLFRHAEGFSDADKGTPLSEGALFRLASMTKPVTAVAALIGVERGWFSLDDDMEKHFPELSKMYVGRAEDGQIVPDHKPYHKLKLHHFLSNTSGFLGVSPLYDIAENSIPKSAYKNNKAMADWCLNNTCFTYEPTVTVGYCGYQAYDLVALLIERYSGKSWADFLDENIFSPLGITDLTYRPTADQWKRLVKMCDRTTGGLCTVELGEHTFEGFPLEYTSAGAGLIGSVDAYFKFAKMLLSGGELDGVRIIKEETLRLMSKPWVSSEVMGQNEAAWGLGVMVRKLGATLPEHTFGWSGAYGTHFWVDPDNKVIAIYMKNSRWYDSHGCGKTGKDFERAVAASFED